MKISEEGQLLRIFIGESDKWEGKPLNLQDTTFIAWRSYEKKMRQNSARYQDLNA
jgi:PII-like signaling protein